MLNSCVKLLIVWTYCIVVVFAEEPYEYVKTSIGPIRGETKFTLFQQKPYFVFKGIPYAQPPIGDLRFLPPQPPLPRTKVYDHFDFKPVCLQFKSANEIIGDEDCLYLNIYTPDADPSAKRAVIFYIHSGAYFYGSGNDDLHGPDFLIDEDVVVVTINYRLNVFGFLSLGTPEYSGNMGLKDQQMALKFIQNNIIKFGGDPRRVTIVGDSSGAACAHFHVLAAGSKGLFQRMIGMSGTALDNWSMNTNASHLPDVMQFTTKRNATIDSYDKLVGFLKTTPATEMLKYFDAESSLSFNLALKWSPVVEVENARQAFMQKYPIEIMNEQHGGYDVDVMFGSASNEGLSFLTQFVQNDQLLALLNETFRVELPSKHFIRNFNDAEYQKAVSVIRQFYLGNNETIDKNTANRFINMFSDIYFNYQLDETVRLHAAAAAATGNTKTYYYRFSASTKLNFFNPVQEPSNTAGGAGHEDILCYLFRCNIISNKYDGIQSSGQSVEMMVLQNLTKLFANFAKYGQPYTESFELKSASINELNFVDITNKGLVADVNPFANRMQFWRDILNKYSGLINKDLKLKNRSVHGYIYFYNLLLKLLSGGDNMIE